MDIQAIFNEAVENKGLVKPDPERFEAALAAKNDKAINELQAVVDEAKDVINIIKNWRVNARMLSELRGRAIYKKDVYFQLHIYPNESVDELVKVLRSQLDIVCSELDQILKDTYAELSPPSRLSLLKKFRPGK